MGRATHAQMLERNLHRDEHARHLVSILQRAGVPVKGTGYGNIFVTENTAGTQYTVTVTHRRQQDAPS